MIATRLRLTVLAAAAVVLASCGSSNTYGSGSNTTAAAVGAGTSAGATTTVDNSAGGYSYGPPASTTTAAATATSSATSGSSASIGLASVDTFGQALVDARGMSVYLFTKDAGGKSACSGACATAWPPVTVTGTPTVGTGLDASKLSTITRDDGTKQLAYNGHPLYFFAADATTGQAGGQGSGGVWFLINAAGDKIA
jgi:predicted lipoprotein with Yx(FWY)xxD motif